jgi:branched-chain amino acid transport system substrate-binding protein
MTRIPRPPAALVLLALAVFGPAACGDDDDNGGGGGGAGDSVNVYSSLPLQGAQRLQTTAMVKGIKLALQQHDGKAGDIEVKYTSLDDSTAQAGNGTPEATQANAQKVAQDDSAVAYIGEFNSGASAVSIPVLNEVPVAQISPSNTAVGLTSDEPGADKGEPDKYYPTGERHYLRIVPKDTIQGAALATVMKQDGCSSTYILNDKEVYGAGLAKNIESSAKEQGLEVPRQTRASTRRRPTSARRRRPSRAPERTASYSRASPQRRRAALQGRRGGAPGREALRAGRGLEP